MKKKTRAYIRFILFFDSSMYHITQNLGNVTTLSTSV